VNRETEAGQEKNYYVFLKLIRQ